MPTASPKTIYAQPGAADTYGTNEAEVFIGTSGKDFFSGNGGDDGALGGAGDDSLFGGAGNDTLWGGEGTDILGGDAGDDVLYGGADADIMNGGTGRDTFMYLATSESGFASNAHDVILFFNHNEGDKLDFGRLDARANQPGQQHFTMVDQPSEAAGTMWFRDLGDHYAVFANTDGGAPDMLINVYTSPGTQLTAADFIL